MLSLLLRFFKEIITIPLLRLFVTIFVASEGFVLVDVWLFLLVPSMDILYTKLVLKIAYRFIAVEENK